MKRPSSPRVLLCSVSVFVALLSLLFTPFSSQAVAFAATTNSHVPAKLTHSRFLYDKAVKASSGLPACLTKATPPLCYSPQQIRRAYGIQRLLDSGTTGKGRTIVIIDDYQSPTLRSDLKLFDNIFGLPDPTLNIIAPFGLKPFDPNDNAAVGFAGEISLDVEWSHAIAPDATIDLVLGNPATSSIQDQINGFVSVTKFAADNNLGSVMSLSVGAGETCYSSTQLRTLRQSFREARENHMTVFVSAGDSGSAAALCNSTGTPVAAVRGVDYPASDPLVSGVGGTTLLAARTGAYMSEVTWDDSLIGAGATGGGFSSLFARPGYQDGVPGIGAARGVPDVAYNADPLTGVLTVLTLKGSTLFVSAGGTSAGAPQWAGIIALADQALGKRLGFLNGAFYRISESTSYLKTFHDIRIGNNTYFFPNGRGGIGVIPGYPAGPGWDPTTGVGTPKGADLVRRLKEFIEANDGSGL